MHLKKLLLTSLAGVTLLSGMAGLTSISAQETLKLGGNFELTGSVASYGTPMHEGVALAVKEINEAGGLLGQEIEYIYYDNQSNLTETASIATRLVDEGVFGVIGPATSGDVQAQIPVINNAGVPAISPAGTLDNITLDEDGNVFEYLFRVCFEDSYQGEAGANFIHTDLELSNAAVVTDLASDYSLGVSDAFTAKFTDLGGNVVVTESVQAGDTDFSAVITTLLAQDFDVLYMPIYYNEAGLFIKQAREMGLTQPIVGSDGYHSDTLIDLAGPANANDVYFTTHFSTASEDPKVQEFLAAFETEYGKQADTFAALAYDAAYLIFEAVERGESAERDSVQQELAATDNFEGVTGTFAIDENHNPVKPALMLGLQNGEIVSSQEVTAE